MLGGAKGVSGGLGAPVERPVAVAEFSRDSDGEHRQREAVVVVAGFVVVAFDVVVVVVVVAVALRAVVAQYAEALREGIPTIARPVLVRSFVQIVSRTSTMQTFSLSVPVSLTLS